MKMRRFYLSRRLLVNAEEQHRLHRKRLKNPNPRRRNRNELRKLKLRDLLLKHEKPAVVVDGNRNVLLGSRPVVVIAGEEAADSIEPARAILMILAEHGGRLGMVAVVGLPPGRYIGKIPLFKTSGRRYLFEKRSCFPFKTQSRIDSFTQK